MQELSTLETRAPNAMVRSSQTCHQISYERRRGCRRRRLSGTQPAAFDTESDLRARKRIGDVRREFHIHKLSDEFGQYTLVMKCSSCGQAWTCNDRQKCRFRMRICPHCGHWGLGVHPIRSEEQHQVGFFTWVQQAAMPQLLSKDARHARLARSLSGLDAAAGRGL
jgi:rRNA maturation protein Nop10